MDNKNNILIKKILIIFLVIILPSCAITNKGELRQNIVSDHEIKLMSYFREGMYYFTSNKYLDAVQSFERALYIHDNNKIKYNLALALERLGDSDKALAIMTALYHNYPDDVNIKMAQARMLDLVGKKDDAILVYNEVLKSLENKSEVKDYRYKAYRRLSDLYFKVGDIQESVCYSQMALNEKNTRDELLRHARLMLSVNIPIKEIYALVKSETQKVKEEQSVQEMSSNNIINDMDAYNMQQYSDTNSFENESESQMAYNPENDGNNDDCRLESIFVWAFLEDFEHNKEMLSEIIARSKECLNNRDPYYQVLVVLENIAIKYNEVLQENTTSKKEEEPENLISDATFLSLPGLAYRYIERFFPTFDIAKN